MLCWVRLGRVVALALVVLLVGPAMLGCAAEESGAAPGGEPLSVQAGFYALQWMAEQVGGDLTDVTSLTEAGAEPHDLELTPTDVADIEDADVVVTLRAFQPAVDAAVGLTDPAKVFDAATAADIEASATGEVDPHFWLDPTRLARVAEAFALHLGEIRPDRAGAFVANAERLAGSLAELDDEFEMGLATCADRNLVTTHNAFGYLARRYGFEPFGITGLTPEDEPSPADLTAITDLVIGKHVTTIYFEPLVSPGIVETVAGETGADTGVLDPIEGLTDSSRGDDYLEVMRANLVSLEKGQGCR